MASPAHKDSDASAAAILAVVERIPRGMVTTYGAVAERAGQPRRARLVGRVLSKLPKGSKVPWHRVVAAGGRIAFPDGSDSHRRQAWRLRREGVAIVGGRVNLREHGWGSAVEGMDRWLWMVGADQDAPASDEN
jgi:methylated-DNA-protein-cysteine methyltransferase related protein